MSTIFIINSGGLTKTEALTFKSSARILHQPSWSCQLATKTPKEGGIIVENVAMGFLSLFWRSNREERWRRWGMRLPIYGHERQIKGRSKSTATTTLANERAGHAGIERHRSHEKTCCLATHCIPWNREKSFSEKMLQKMRRHFFWFNLPFLPESMYLRWWPLMSH